MTMIRFVPSSMELPCVEPMITHEAIDSRNILEPLKRLSSTTKSEYT
jgi:hypothetical protein